MRSNQSVRRLGSRAAEDLLVYLESSGVVQILTRTRDGREIVTPIWSVAVDGVGYVRNGWGESSQWYRRAMRSGDVGFIEGQRRHLVRLSLADRTVLDAVDAAYLRKYRGQPTDAVVRDPARAYTLQVTERTRERA